MARRFIDNARVSSLLVVLALLAIVLTTSAAHALSAPASVSVTSSPATSSVLGQAVTFTISVNGPAPIPTGEVSLYLNSQLIGIVQLDASGNASLSTALLPVGSDSIVASYSGDGNYSPLSSAPLPFSVNPRSATVTAAASPNPVAVGVSTTVTGNVYDQDFGLPSEGAFNATTNNLPTVVSGHAAVLLSDGTVLITGGTVAGSAVKAVELYNPGSNPPAGSFTSVTGDLASARSGHTATLLADGVTTLIAGGDTSGDAELYTYNLTMPGTGASTETGVGLLQAARSGHTATLLPNGQVLIIGGTVGGSGVNSAEVYDPTGKSFTSVTKGLAYARSGHTTTLLSYSGTVATLLVAGGDATGTAELITYDFSTTPGTLAQVGSATWMTARTGHTATLLPDGKTILFAGGMQGGVAVASAEIYQIPSDLTSFTSFATVAAPDNMIIARAGHTATLLDSAFVLLIGGETEPTPPTQSAELYTPAYDPLGTVAFGSSVGTDDLAATMCSLVLGGQGGSSCSITLIPRHVNGGSHTITATYTSDGNHITDVSNTTPLAVTVSKGTQATVTLAGPSTATYGQTGLSVVASGGSGTGAYTYSAGASTACSVDPNLGTLTITSGTGTCSITATRAADSDYNLSAASAPRVITVSQASLTITAANQTITYGGSLTTLGPGQVVPTFTALGLQNGDTVGSVTISTTAATVAPGGLTPTLTNDPVGSYTLTPSAATGGTFIASNYTIHYVNGTLNINKATLTITASPESKTYGQQLSTVGLGQPAFTSVGLQNGETVGSVTLANPGAAAAAQVAGSPYLITPSAATGGTFTASNYTIIYDTGLLTVNPAPLTITASPQSGIYGHVITPGTTAFTTNPGGLQNTDTVTSVALVSTGTALCSNVASYSIVPSNAAGTGLSSGGISNYTITYTNGTLSITPASTSVIMTIQPLAPAAASTTYLLQAVVVPQITTTSCAAPSGTVTFSNPASLGTTASLTSATATYGGTAYNAGVGSYTSTASQLSSSSTPYVITPSYSGETNYFATSLGNPPAYQGTVSITEASLTVAPLVQDYPGVAIPPTALSAAGPITLSVNAPADIELNNLTCVVKDVNLNPVAYTACTVASSLADSSTLTGTATLTVNVATSSTDVQPLADLRHFRPIFAILGFPVFGFLLIGLPGGIWRRRRNALTWLGLALVVITLLGLIGCSSGFKNSVPIATLAGTPPGNYVVVVNGTYPAATISSAQYNTTTVMSIPFQVQ